jgi:hypothetical protein
MERVTTARGEKHKRKEKRRFAHLLGLAAALCEQGRLQELEARVLNAGCGP